MKSVFVMRLLFLILSLALGTPGTTIQDNGDGHIPSIPVNVKESHRLKLSDIALEVKRIEPEFSEESALGRIRKVQVYNDSLFVLDQYDNLLVFDNKGKYYRQIGRPWKSRSWGSNFSDFTIDDGDGSLYISTSRNDILMFDNHNRSFSISGVRPSRAGIYSVDGQLIVFSYQALEKTSLGLRNQTEMFICSPNDGNIDSLIVTRSYPKTTMFSFMTTYDYISRVEDNTYIYVPVLDSETIVRDTVYRFHDNKLLPALKLEFSNEGELDDSGIKTIWLAKIWLAGDYVFADYTYKKEKYLYCYDFRTGKGVNTKQGIRDDIFRCGTIEIRPLGNGMFYYTHRREGTEGEKNPDIYIGKFK